MKANPDSDSAGSTMSSLARSGQRRPAFLWRNGQLESWSDSKIHVTSVGHASVASVFEGIKAYLSNDSDRLLLFRLQEHIKRLFQSARMVRLSIPYEPETIIEAILTLLRANGYTEDVYIRPWVFPAGIIREQMVPADVACEVVIDSWTFESGLGRERGCRAAISSWTRISESSMPPRVKAFSNYHNGRLAMVEARQNGHDWPILLNERGKVSEAPGACVAIVRDGVVHTPCVSSSILESLTRDSSIRLISELGYDIVEREIDRTELYLADEIFFMGTGWEILPVTSIDGLEVGNGTMGPITRALEQEYERLVRGSTKSHASWLTEVRLNL